MAIFSITKKALTLALSVSVFGIAGCASINDIPNPVTMPNGDYGETVRYLPHAATTPIRDLNIGVSKVPRQLKLLQNPYGTDTITNCASIKKEMSDLQQALQINHKDLNGPDFDHDTRAGYTGEAAHDLVTAAATSIVPYRGIIRYASGATRREKQGISADRRGRQRLGFLIGVGAAKRCPGFHAKQNPIR